MNEKETVDFKLFIALWNRLQNQKTPHIHFRMAQWLETAWRKGDTRLLLMAFRSGGKSTITGLFAAWLLSVDPSLRIMVLAADMTLARRMVRNVKRIIERHPLTAHFKPPRADQWGAERFTIRRDSELRDPSMIAKGLNANVTGARADVIICDDVEVPKTCDTAEKRAQLRERLAEIDYILVPGGMQLYIGTPHSWYSIYAQKPREEIGEIDAFLSGFKRLLIPVHDENEKSAWPEKFPPETIAQIKRSSGPNKFASQMLLRPVNVKEGRLDLAKLRFYVGNAEYSAEMKGLYLRGRRLISCSAWWDPSLGKPGGDASVLVVVFTDEEGEYWLHDITYIEIDLSEEGTELEQQCRKVAFRLQLNKVPVVTVENNGVGGYVTGALRKAISQNKVACTVKSKANTRPKDERILEAFDPVLAARSLHVHERIKKTPFLMEMQEWRPGVKGQRDDGLDAAAGALSMEPVLFKYERFYARQDWQGHAGKHEADTEFDV